MIVSPEGVSDSNRKDSVARRRRRPNLQALLIRYYNKLSNRNAHCRFANNAYEN